MDALSKIATGATARSMTGLEMTRLELARLDIPLERGSFMRELLRQLAGVLEDVVGLDEASGFISIVGQRIGTCINDEYRRGHNVRSLSREQIAGVLVDLKRRIQGDFFIIEQTDSKIVLGNRVCPFAEKVKDRPSLCMMTSNVFGTIAAENAGYAKVVIERAIASGDAQCRVVVYFEPTAAEGRDYYQASE